MMSETRRKHSKTNSRIPRAPILVPIRINCLYDSNTLAFYNFLLEGNRADINIQWIAIIQSDQTRTVNNPIPKNKTTPQNGKGTERLTIGIKRLNHDSADYSLYCIL